jgi:hypothetical protein
MTTKLYITGLIFILSLILPVSSVFAITFTPSSFVEGETSVTVTCTDLVTYPSSEYGIFDSNGNKYNGNVCEQFFSGDFSPAGDYTVIEFQNGSSSCTTVLTCELDPTYIDSASVTVTAPVSDPQVLSNTIATTTDTIKEITVDNTPKVLAIAGGLTALGFLIWYFKRWVGRK